MRVNMSCMSGLSGQSKSSTKESQVATTDVTNRGVGERDDTAPTRRTVARFYDETKAAIKSTEFYAYLVTFAGILIAAQVIGDGDAGAGGDAFNANRAWLYLTILTVGYMVSRGLAKAGSAHRDQDVSRHSD
jgi:hypothetical protein